MIDPVAVMNRIREVIASVADFERVYAQSSNDEHALPDAVSEFPAVLIMAGPVDRHGITQPQERIDYKVRVLMLSNEMGDIGASAWKLLPLSVAIRRAFLSNITLGGLANPCKPDVDTGLVSLNWNGVDYVGNELTLLVSEQGSTGGVEAGY